MFSVPSECTQSWMWKAAFFIADNWKCVLLFAVRWHAQCIHFEGKLLPVYDFVLVRGDVQQQCSLATVWKICSFRYAFGIASPCKLK